MASIPTFSTSSSSSLPTISPHASSRSNPNHQSFTFPITSLFGTRINLQRLTLTRSPSNTNCRATSATVSFSLPTPKPQPDAPDKVPRWSARAIKSYAMAELEARKLKYPNTGTEALLMGILVEDNGKVFCWGWNKYGQERSTKDSILNFRANFGPSSSRVSPLV